MQGLKFDILIVITGRTGKDLRGIFRWSTGPAENPTGTGFADITGTVADDEITWSETAWTYVAKLAGDKMTFRRTGRPKTSAAGGEGEGTLQRSR